jgi:hypothetical protein
VPAEQALVQERGVPPGEEVEVRAVRFRADVVGDDLDPGAGDRVMVFLRGPLVRGHATDPGADFAGGLRHAVTLYREEGQVDVLTVPELPGRAGDRGQDRG